MTCCLHRCHNNNTAAMLDTFTRLPAEAVPARRTEAQRLLSAPDSYHALVHAAATGASSRATAFDITRHGLEARLDADWTHDAEAWLELLQASWSESAQFCASLAWTARKVGSSALLHLTPERVLHSPTPPVTARARLHLYAVTLRYDFRCRSLQHLLEQHPRPLTDLDPFTRALYAFALLGQSDPAGLGHIDSLLADSGNDPKVAHCLLHGLWLGEDLPHQPGRLLSLLDTPAFAGKPDAIALFRKASALRRLHRHDDALSTIDEAREQLPPDTDPFVHADLTRERALITAARDRAT
ncbi:MAG TPA: hypothetical protein VN520_20885 [Streptomyces sp.]|uniref:hypothetical protein n=1 Tax=Streptomyces sp. TaxID=1931 RepID=UPI002BBD7D7E|nr:hypothetical protein [Streptomyces sp.]HWU08803.1 hypothetical protein [Streptomyces sp.]